MNKLNKTTLTLGEARQLLKNKKGAGKSKETEIKLTIKYKGGIVETEAFIAMIQAIFTAEDRQGLQYNHYGEVIELKEQVVTELEDNKNWD
jgi:hypothetical protein